MTIRINDRDVTITLEDLLEYLKPYDYDSWQEEGREAYKQALKDLIEAEWFDTDSLCEWLGDEEEFIEFITKRH